MIILSNHFNDNPTIIINLDGDKYIANGCQVFSEADKEETFQKFEVDQDCIDDVNKALNDKKLNIKATSKEIIEAVKQNGWALEYVKDQETKEAIIERMIHG